MNHKVLLTITSLLSVLLLSFHLTEDIVRGFEAGKTFTYFGVLIMAVWLYATLVLTERRSGYIIILLASLLGAYVPYIHMTGAGMVGGRIAASSGKFFWVWTLLASGATTIVSAVLSAQGLWSLRRS